MKPKHSLRSLLLVASSSLLAISSAHAQLYWDGNDDSAGFGTATGTWAVPTTGTTTSGWSSSGTGVTVVNGNSVTTATSDAVNFGNGATGLGAGTITVDGTVASGNMTFASGSGAIELSGGTINLAAATSITVNNTTNTISSAITGAGTSLTKTGTGRLILSGTSTTRTGGTSITGGNLTVAGTSATTSMLGTGAVTWATTNTTLQFQSDSNLSVSNSFGTSGTRNIGRTLVVDRLTGGDASSLTYTFSAQQFIDTGSTLTLSAGSNITSGTPTINFSGGVRSTDSSAGTITLTPNGVNFRLNGFSNTRNRTITLAGNSAGNEIYGAITQNATYSASVVKSGASTWKLSGAHTYVGTTSVSGGTLQVNGSLAAGGGLVTVATGGTLNVGATGSISRNVTVSGGSLGLAGTISGAGNKLTLASGTVATAAGTPTVATADFSAGAGTATASTPLAITSTLNLPGGTNATLTGGTSFTAAGINLADNNVAREISLSGGTLALNRLVTESVALTNPSFETDAGTANSFLYLDITGWDGGTGIEQGTSRTFAPAAPPNQNASTDNKWAFIQNAQTMSQTFNVAEAGNYTVSFAYAGRPSGSGPLYVQAQVDATNVTGVLIPSTSAWTIAAGTPVSLTAGSHTLSFVFTNPLGGDKSSVLDAVAVTKQVAFSINLPNTNIAATASSRLDLGTTALNHTLGTLSIANNGTQLTLPVATGGTIAFANSGAIPWDGTLNITGDFVSGSSIRFGTTGSGLTATQLDSISVNGNGLGTYTLNVDGYLESAGAPTGFAGWQAANATMGGFDDDHDNDGVSNGIEYFLGGTTDTTGFTTLPAPVPAGSTFSITWSKGTGYDGDYDADFVVETSATLAPPWNTEEVDENVTLSGDDVIFTFPLPLGTKNFARLRVTGP